MNQLKIPKSFEMIGSTVNVEFEGKRTEENEASGLAIYTENKILLNSQLLDQPIENAQVVFWHEFFHFVFNAIGHKKNNFNEDLLDQLGGIMTQFFRTVKWSK